MRRREFIKAITALSAGWPLTARAQQVDRVRRVGFLRPTAENDPETQTSVGEFTQRLQELGWTDGRNVRIDFRFGGADAMRISALATELVEGHPDVIIATGSLAVAGSTTCTKTIGRERLCCRSAALSQFRHQPSATGGQHHRLH
jgi:putative ABC transport system substrate-binding protein